MRRVVWIYTFVLGVLASCVAGLAAASEARFTAACTRSGVPQARCACAAEPFRQSVGSEDFQLFVRFTEWIDDFETRNPGKQYWVDEALDAIAREIGVQPKPRGRYQGTRRPGTELLDRHHRLKNPYARALMACPAAGAPATAEGDPATTSLAASAEPAPPPAPASAIRRRIEADKRPGVDRKVFGVELGEEIDLPPCPEKPSAATLFPGLGVDRGAEKTCQGDRLWSLADRVPGELGRMFGVRSVDTGVGAVAVRLADDQCPQWLRLGGRCVIQFAVQEGLAVGAVVLPSPHPEQRDDIVRQLTRKYGAPRLGEIIECRNRQTGFVTAEGQERHWSLPGLRVDYRPVAGNCTLGRITISLDVWHQHKTEAQRLHEESEPQM